MLVVRASSCKEGRYGIFLQLYTKVKAQPTWGSLSRSSALASADIISATKGKKDTIIQLCSQDLLSGIVNLRI